MADDEPTTDPVQPESPEDLPVIHVSDWFGERHEICLELDGVRYRLRITRRNKLILQK